MPLLILGILAGVLLLSRSASATTSAPTPKPKALPPGGGGLSLPADIAKDAGVIAAAGVAAVAGAEAGNTVDHALFGDAKTTADKVREDAAIAGGAVTGALAVFATVGWVAPYVAFAIFVVCFFVYSTIAWIAALLDGPRTHADGVADYVKARNTMVKSIYDNLRVQPNLTGISDTEIYRQIYPFVDGYLVNQDYRRYLQQLNFWSRHQDLAKIGITSTFNFDAAPSMAEIAQKLYDQGAVVGTVQIPLGTVSDYASWYKGVPRELLLSYGGSASDNLDKSGAWAAKYTPPSQQVDATDSVFVDTSAAFSGTIRVY